MVYLLHMLYNLENSLNEVQASSLFCAQPVAISPNSITAICCTTCNTLYNKSKRSNVNKGRLSCRFVVQHTTPSDLWTTQACRVDALMLIITSPDVVDGVATCARLHVRPTTRLPWISTTNRSSGVCAIVIVIFYFFLVPYWWTQIIIRVLRTLPLDTCPSYRHFHRQIFSRLFLLAADTFPFPIMTRSVVVRPSDLWSTGCEFDFRPCTVGLVLGWVTVYRRVNHLSIM